MFFSDPGKGGGSVANRIHGGDVARSRDYDLDNTGPPDSVTTGPSDNWGGVGGGWPKGSWPGLSGLPKGGFARPKGATQGGLARIKRATQGGAGQA